MSLTVIELDKYATPQMLIGILQRRMLEVREGLFVGNLSSRIREEAWSWIEKLNTASAIMLWHDNSEWGFSMKTHGSNRRKVIKNYGIELIQYKKHFSKEESQNSSG